MGRQVLWGGKGRPPSREVLNAAAKAARSEMMQRIRENKDKSGQPGRGAGSRNGGGRNANGNGQRSEGQSARSGNGNGNGGQPARNGNGSQQARNGNGGPPPRGRSQQPSQRSGNGQGARPPQQQQPRDVRQDRDDDGDERMPSNVDPLRTNMPSVRDMNGVKRVNVGGQPDPTRTSIDSMGAGRRGGGGGNRGRGGPPARGNYGR
jgi:ATP-dependent RNA helicase RhlE